MGRGTNILVDGRVLFAGLICALRRHVDPSRVIALFTLLLIGGCGGTTLHARTAISGTIVENKRADHDATMTADMTDEHKIRNMSEANAAALRALRAQSAKYRLLDELLSPGLSKQERSRKEQEIDKIMDRYNREIAPVEKFFKEHKRNDKEIRNLGEANGANLLAQRTLMAIYSVDKEIKSKGLSERERTDKELEIDRLRRQYRRERAPIEAFFKRLESKGEQLSK